MKNVIKIRKLLFKSTIPRPVLYFLFSIFFFTPSLAFAQRNFAGLVSDLIGLISGAAWILIAIAFVVFLYGIVRFIYSSGDSKGNQEGKQTILWGIVALVVLFSLWGITSIIQFTFGL